MAELVERVARALAMEIQRQLLEHGGSKNGAELDASAIARAAIEETLRAIQIEAALAPFAKVCAAFDYWAPEAMPHFCYPEMGTNLELAREDCPDAIGHLDECDFRRAAETLAALQQIGEEGK